VAVPEKSVVSWMEVVVVGSIELLPQSFPHSQREKLRYFLLPVAPLQKRKV
jgi:hypothetical protein